VENYWRANKDVFQEALYAQLCGIDNIVFSGGLTLGPLLVGHLMEKIGSGNTNAVFAGICGLTMVVTGIYKGRTKGNLDDRADQDG
jgi:hypothetical protein